MSDVESENVGGATPADLVDGETDGDLVVSTGEDGGASTDPAESLPDDQIDAVLT